MVQVNVLDICKGLENVNILKAMLKCHAVIQTHFHIVVSISGGSDSDIMLDMIERVKGDREVTYQFFDTGVEYKATKDHLDFLENKYGIKIQRLKAIKPIPLCVREYGQPFINKRVSEYMEILQRHNFKFEDLPYETLLKQYPKCKSVIDWWCNKYGDGVDNRFNIERNPYLKEFLTITPPQFRISAKCCTWAKKKVAKQQREGGKFDLECIGVRKAEGGIRATSYKSCYDDNAAQGKLEIDKFRPVFWLTDEDKVDYENFFGVTHSKCYTKYGFKRTGCVGCPFNTKVFSDLQAVETHEPKLYNFCTAMFKDTYAYTKAYRDFVKQMKLKEQIEKEKAQGFEQIRIM